MQARGIIEEMVTRELRGLCITCAHVESCQYFRNAAKEIIQCEMYEMDGELRHPEPLKGLCQACDNASACALPGKRTGVWHCNEFS